MTSRDFCYWLQGYFEILGAGSERDANEGRLSSGQVECVRKHLHMVFIHEIDPAFPKQQQAALTQAHTGGAAGIDPKSLVGGLSLMNC